MLPFRLLHRVNEARLRLVREQERFIAAEQARREGELRQRLAAQKKRLVAGAGQA